MSSENSISSPWILYEINTSLYKIVNIDTNLKLWVGIFDRSLMIGGGEEEEEGVCGLKIILQGHFNS